MELDHELSSAASVVGLVLVFVFGYFVAALPFVEELIERQAPQDESARRRLHSRLRVAMWVMRAQLVAAAGACALLLAGVLGILAELDLSQRFSMLRAAFVGAEIGLLTLVVAAAIQAHRLRLRSAKVYAYAPTNGRSLSDIDAASAPEKESSTRAGS